MKDLFTYIDKENKHPFTTPPNLPTYLICFSYMIIWTIRRIKLLFLLITEMKIGFVINIQTELQSRIIAYGIRLAVLIGQYICLMLYAQNSENICFT